MANSIAYAAKYSGELDKMITQECKTGFLSDNVWKAKFAGANTVYLPDVSMIGLGNYSRSSGYSKGDTTLTMTAYTLSKERSRQLYIDAQDADESGVPDLAGKLVGEYTRNYVNPEIDAYVIQQLVTRAKTQSHVTTLDLTTDTSNNNGVAAALIAAINNVESATGYSNTQLVAFVDPTVYGLLQTTTELSRQIVISDFKQGEVTYKVKSINGCAIIPVAANRMKSAFTFNAGSTTSAGGFSAASGAKDIHAVILPRDSAKLVKKVDKINIFNPNEVEDMDAYKINYRLYYDLIIEKSKYNTIYAISNASLA